jgi:hypothetical protein
MRVVDGLWVALFVMLAILPELAYAQMYRWVDERGIVHFTDDLNSIPERFKSQVTPPSPPAKRESPVTSPGATLYLPDTPETRRAAAQRYLAAFPVEDMLADTVRHMAQTIPESQRPEFVQLMTQMIRVDWLNRVMLDLAVKHFTVRELDALARFYGSPHGKSILKKMGPYMGEALPLIQAEVIRAANELGAKAR